MGSPAGGSGVLTRGQSITQKNEGPEDRAFAPG